MLLHFKRQSFKTESFCFDIALYPAYMYPPKASLQKGFLTKGWPAKRSAPTPLWQVAEGRLVYGGWLSGDMRDIRQHHDKETLFWKTVFWNVGGISKRSRSKEGPAQDGISTNVPCTTRKDPRQKSTVFRNRLQQSCSGIVFSKVALKNVLKAVVS